MSLRLIRCVHNLGKCSILIKIKLETDWKIFYNQVSYYKNIEFYFIYPVIPDTLANKKNPTTLILHTSIFLNVFQI